MQCYFEESDSIACIEPRLRLPEATKTWAEVQEHTLRDANLQNFKKKIEDGFKGIPSRLDFASGLREFFQFKDELSTVDGVILYNNRTVPSPLRALILDTLHSAHQGTSCITSRAESSVFCPGSTPAIANLSARCRSCNEPAPSQPHGPPLTTQEAVYPFQCNCADYFKYKGCNYMVVVDRYSGWFIVNQRTNPEQAKDPPTAKPQTPQPETKRQVLTGAEFTQRPQRHRQLLLKPHSSSTALHMSPSEMRTSLCWTKIPCPTSFLLNHLTRSPNVVINLTKPVHPTSHP